MRNSSAFQKRTGSYFENVVIKFKKQWLVYKLWMVDQMKYSTEGTEIVVVNLAFQRGSLSVLI